MAKQHTTKSVVTIMVAPEERAQVMRKYMASGMQDMDLQQKFAFLYVLAGIAVGDCKTEHEMMELVSKIRAEVIQEDEIRKQPQGVR